MEFTDNENAAFADILNMLGYCFSKISESNSSL